MNRVSVRTKYVGAEPTLRGRIGWVHRPTHDANEGPWMFQADDGTEMPCKGQDVTVWLGGSDTANAA